MFLVNSLTASMPTYPIMHSNKTYNFMKIKFGLLSDDVVKVQT